ncbi:GNAT family N-acetyltransferase [Tenggerimyces flavus]|uniref:GNAT family N-acetyltransferase n=1 Tax=Tenggerimyces flavus TaxID=1708749 RepID=A0ABV7YPJ2_9ACTN|nr:GNAT family N-acetyltransferase [Tenggerimyces flavus]MBM7787768.1 putative GNAT family acetyltransferase [Tenggerimyces flavus]
MTAVVKDNPSEERFEVHDGDQLAGSLYYEQRGEALALIHTEIDPAFGGRGLGSVLVRRTLEQLRERGVKIVPLCPFVKSWMEKHPEYDDLKA